VNKKRVANVLEAHADGLIGRSEGMRQTSIEDMEQAEVAPLLRIAERLHQSMRRVQPREGFLRSLKRELTDRPNQRVTVAKRPRRSFLIGAAAVGSVVSIASVLGAVLFLVPRQRARAHARVAHAPTG
jgi:hypothetical protein